MNMARGPNRSGWGHPHKRRSASDWRSYSLDSKQVLMDCRKTLPYGDSLPFLHIPEMEKNMSKIRLFLASEKFGSFLSVATMASKYAIALLLLFITWKWNFLVPFLLSIVGSFLIGIGFHAIAPKMFWLAKYIVTVAELALLQWYSQAITKSLVLVCIFMFPFLLLIVSETAHSTGKQTQNKFVRWIGHLGDKLYGLERVSKFTLGAYFSFVFGLQSMFNEVILLWSYGLIGAVEIDGREFTRKCVKTVKQARYIRIVFLPDSSYVACCVKFQASEELEKEVNQQ